MNWKHTHITSIKVKRVYIGEIVKSVLGSLRYISVYMHVCVFERVHGYGLTWVLNVYVNEIKGS